MSRPEATGQLESPAVLALVTDAYGRLGGIAQYNRDFLDALESASAHVVVVSLNPIDSSRSTERFVLAHCNGSRTKFVFKVMRAALKQRPQVVFCGHINLAYVAYRAARLVGARFWLHRNLLGSCQLQHTIIQMSSDFFHITVAHCQTVVKLALGNLAILLDFATTCYT